MEVLLNYIPFSAHNQVVELLKAYPIKIKITKKRLTKHGDYRLDKKGNPSITINASENPYRFLITLLHELAHYCVYLNYGRKASPHGTEWKSAFRAILLPFLNPVIFPDPLCGVLAKHMKNPKASSDRDFNLVMALRQWDKEVKSNSCVYELENGQTFALENGRKFVKLQKRRTRYECREIATGCIYIFSPHAEVKPY